MKKAVFYFLVLGLLIIQSPPLLALPDCKHFYDVIMRAKTNGWTERQVAQALEGKLQEYTEQCLEKVAVYRARARCAAIGGRWHWTVPDQEGVCLAKAVPIPCCVENWQAANDMCPPCNIDAEIPAPTDPPPNPNAHPEACIASASVSENTILVGQTVTWQWESLNAQTCNITIQTEQGNQHYNTLHGSTSITYNSPGEYALLIQCQNNSHSCQDQLFIHVTTPQCTIGNVMITNTQVKISTLGTQKCWFWISSPDCYIDERETYDPVTKTYNPDSYGNGQLGQTDQILLANALNIPIDQYYIDNDGIAFENFFLDFESNNGGINIKTIDLQEIIKFGPNTIANSAANYYKAKLVCQCQHFESCQNTPTNNNTFFTDTTQDKCYVIYNEVLDIDAPTPEIAGTLIPLYGDRETWTWNNGNPSEEEIRENINKCIASRLGWIVVLNP